MTFPFHSLKISTCIQHLVSLSCYVAYTLNETTRWILISPWLAILSARIFFRLNTRLFEVLWDGVKIFIKAWHLFLLSLRLIFLRLNYDVSSSNRCFSCLLHYYYTVIQLKKVILVLIVIFNNTLVVWHNLLLNFWFDRCSWSVLVLLWRARYLIRILCPILSCLVTIALLLFLQFNFKSVFSWDDIAWCRYFKGYGCLILKFNLVFLYVKLFASRCRVICSSTANR